MLCEMKLGDAVFCHASCRSISVNWSPWQQFSHALYIFPCLQQHTLHTPQLPGIGALGQRIVNNCIPCIPPPTSSTRPRKCIGAKNDEHCIPCIPPNFKTRMWCIWTKKIVVKYRKHKKLVFSNSWFGNLGQNGNLHFVGIANNVFSCVSSLILMCHINGAVFLPPNSSFVFVWIELRFQPNSNEQYQLRSFSS